MSLSAWKKSDDQREFVCLLQSKVKRFLRRYWRASLRLKVSIVTQLSAGFFISSFLATQISCKMETGCFHVYRVFCKHGRAQKADIPNITRQG